MSWDISSSKIIIILLSQQRTEIPNNEYVLISINVFNFVGAKARNSRSIKCVSMMKDASEIVKTRLFSCVDGICMVKMQIF